MAQPEIVLALDLPDRAEALRFLGRIGPGLPWVKIGLQLFCREGPAVVEAVAAAGPRVFLDLKLHDIPNTVASAVRSLVGLPVDLITVHASGGAAMVGAAIEAAAARPGLGVVAVTVLTSIDRATLTAVGVAAEPEEQVARLARVALGAGAHGLVCSPQEVAALRAAHGAKPRLVVPGIRAPGAAADDQRRTLSAAEAAAAGADLLVVGRPLLAAADPAAALAELRRSLTGAAP